MDKSERASKEAMSSEEHRCYYCGDEDTVLIPVCKGCIKSFNDFIEEELKEEEKASRTRDKLEIDRPKLGEDVEDWATELCERCEMWGFEYAWDEDEKDLDKPLKWLCVGGIIKPDIPKNRHEEFNQVRICILKSLKPFNVSSHEWTPWEALRVVVALGSAISNCIVEDQPKKPTSD